MSYCCTVCHIATYVTLLHSMSHCNIWHIVAQYVTPQHVTYCSTVCHIATHFTLLHSMSHRHTFHIVAQYVTLQHMTYCSTVCHTATYDILQHSMSHRHMCHLVAQYVTLPPLHCGKYFIQADGWVISKSSVGMHGVMWLILDVLSLQNWRDDYLTWNSSDFSGIQKIMLPLAEIWIPDVAVENSAESVQGHFSRNTDSYGVVWNTGKTIIPIYKMWLKRIMLVAAG